MGNSKEIVNDCVLGYGKIVAVCLSEKKHVAKTMVEKVFVQEGWGIVGDAHAGPGHRQISFLSSEAISDMQKKANNISFGIFGENIVYNSIPFEVIKPGCLITVGDVQIKVTQIGKECPTPCSIFHSVGFCIMPEQGIFGVVIRSGEIIAGDCVVITC